jgi:hypothetical protein
MLASIIYGPLGLRATSQPMVLIGKNLYVVSFTMPQASCHAGSLNSRKLFPVSGCSDIVMIPFPVEVI